MSTLFADPLGRALLTLLTTDYGLPGAPQRAVLFRALQDLRAQAETMGASAQVQGAIRSALWALRAEFPGASVTAAAARIDATASGRVGPPAETARLHSSK
jgi:hypothetical protein